MTLSATHILAAVAFLLALLSLAPATTGWPLVPIAVLLLATCLLIHS